MSNSIKKVMFQFQKFYFIETCVLILSTVFSRVYMSTSLLISFIILGVGLFLYFNILTAHKNFLDTYHCFFYNNPIFSSRGILSQNSKKCKYDCQEVISCLMSKKEVKKIISNLPKGKYKSITHSSVINAINTFGSEIYISEVLYKDSLSNIRKKLLGKKCPCSDDVECKYRKYISFAQQQDDITNFHYIEFTIK